MSSGRGGGPQRNSKIDHNKTKHNQFLVKKNKHTVVQDEGDGGIPFSAVKEVYRYKAFVSRLSPHSDVDAMTRYINDRLKVNAMIKVVSKPNAPVLSVMLFCTSESNALDLKMPGLWPRGTLIDSFKPKNKRKYGNKLIFNQTWL